MRIADAEILFVPGRSRPGPEHWQRRWSEKFSTARWIESIGWETAVDFEERIGGLFDAIIMSTRPVVLVAHSLGVITTSHTAKRIADAKVRGAFLVAPPDIDSPGEIPPEMAAFRRVPTDPLPFPSMLIASDDDPYCEVDRAVGMAMAWGSDFHLAPNAGHLNVASGYGPWPEGLMMFTRLMQRLR